MQVLRVHRFSTCSLCPALPPCDGSLAFRHAVRRLTCGSDAALDTIQGKVEDVKIA